MASAGVPAVSAVERRRRVYELVDAADRARGRSLRWVEQALEMYRADGDVTEARLLLFSALDCVSDYATIYRGWIAMELRHGNVSAARALFGEWLNRACSADPGGAGPTDAGFWCRYIAFEGCHGDGAAAAREVAEDALEACPRDAAVYAAYAKMELRRGHGGRASAVLDRAMATLADDAAAKEWLLDEMRAFRDAMCAKTLGGRLRRIFGGVARFRRSPRGYEHHSGHDKSLESLDVGAVHD